MGAASHQTSKLSRGKHQSPDDGTCVMELASMLAGEPFTDQPESVCPVIASFMRAYNDSIDDGRRQDLYAYASKVVGSRGCESVQGARVEHLTAWGLAQRQHRWTRLLPRFLRSLAWMPELDVIGPQVVRAIPTHDARSHTQALALIDELLAIGRPQPPASGAGGVGRGIRQPPPPRTGACRRGQRSGRRPALIEHADGYVGDH